MWLTTGHSNLFFLSFQNVPLRRTHIQSHNGTVHHIAPHRRMGVMMSAIIRRPGAEGRGASPTAHASGPMIGPADDAPRARPTVERATRCTARRKVRGTVRGPDRTQADAATRPKEEQAAVTQRNSRRAEWVTVQSP